jgi:branched-chain amino acid transport system ATP-binding protein
MSVLENLIVAQHNALMRASGYTILGVLGVASYRHAEKAAVARARDWLARTGLTERADWNAANLPYGDQRRLEIARAMCTRPRLLCLDEPAAGLNPRETADLGKLLIGIRDEFGIGVLLIEHDMSVVMGISDHIVVLDYGRKIADGTADQIKRDPNVIKAYLGETEEEDLPPEVAADLGAAR